MVPKLVIFVGIADHDVQPTEGELIVMLLRGDKLRHAGGQDDSVEREEAAEIAHHGHGSCRVRGVGGGRRYSLFVYGMVCGGWWAYHKIALTDRVE